MLFDILLYVGCLALIADAMVVVFCPVDWFCRRCQRKVGTAPRCIYWWRYSLWRDVNCPHCKRDLLRAVADYEVDAGLLRAASGCGEDDELLRAAE